MRQLKRASDLTKEFLKDAEYRQLYEEVAINATLALNKSKSIEEANTALLRAIKEARKSRLN
jgi:hypothetical protein